MTLLIPKVHKHKQYFLYIFFSTKIINEKWVLKEVVTCCKQCSCSLFDSWMRSLPNHDASSGVNESISLRLCSFLMPVSAGITILGNETHMSMNNELICVVASFPTASLLTAIPHNFENSINLQRWNVNCDDFKIPSLVYYSFAYSYKHALFI